MPSPHLWPAAGPPPCSRGRRCRRSRKATAIAGDGGGGGDDCDCDYSKATAIAGDGGVAGDGNMELDEGAEGDLLELLESIDCDCMTVSGN